MTPRRPNLSIVGAVVLVIAIAGCGSGVAPSPTVSPSGPEPTAVPNGSPPVADMTRGPAATARELAAQLLVDFDAAMEIERSTRDDSVFTSAIASWYEDEFAYLTENQALFASKDGFASIGHPLLVIEDSLSAGDPVVLRLAVRQLADVRDLLAAVH